MRNNQYFRVEKSHAGVAAQLGFTPRYFSERLSRGKLPCELRNHRVKRGNGWVYDWNKCRELLIERLV